MAPGIVLIHSSLSLEPGLSFFIDFHYHITYLFDRVASPPPKWNYLGKIRKEALFKAFSIYLSYYLWFNRWFNRCVFGSEGWLGYSLWPLIFCLVFHLPWGQVLDRFPGPPLLLTFTYSSLSKCVFHSSLSQSHLGSIGFKAPSLDEKVNLFCLSLKRAFYISVLLLNPKLQLFCDVPDLPS